MSETTSDPRAIAATVAALPSSAGERFADRVAARHKVDGEWRELTYAEVVGAIDEVALGLIELGIESGDRVAILADTRLEWTLASYGISAAGGVVVPVYPTNSPRECQWVLATPARARSCARTPSSWPRSSRCAASSRTSWPRSGSSRSRRADAGRAARARRRRRPVPAGRAPRRGRAR